MEKLQKFAASKLKPQKDDDIVDRLNYYWSSTMFSILALVIIGKQYVGQPIQCWIPAEFKGGWEKYSENYCFVENTYYVGFNESFPQEKSIRQKSEIPYYQWVPFFFAAQMFLFMLPKMLWNIAKGGRKGLDINALVELASLTTRVGDTKQLKKESSAETAGKIREIFDYTDVRRRVSDHRDDSIHPIASLEPEYLRPQKYSARGRVSYSYLLFKAANVVNTLMQLVLLNNFLGPDYKLWGYGILVDLINGRQWLHSGHFPRVTFCDVGVRDLGNRFMNHTFQCVLMINMINEKLFIFVWFWLVFLLCANVIDLLKWCYWIFFPASAEKFIDSLLEMAYMIEDTPTSHKTMLREKVNGFVTRYLCRDGVTVLRLIDINSGGAVATGIVKDLWKVYRDIAEESEESTIMTNDSKQQDLIPTNSSSTPVKNGTLPFFIPPKHSAAAHQREYSSYSGDEGYNTVVARAPRH